MSAQECPEPLPARLREALHATFARLARVCRMLAPATAILAFLLLAGCGRSPDENALREALGGMLAAAEARNPDDFMEHVADDFAASKGLDRQQLHRMLVVQFMRNKSVGVTTGPLEIVIDGKRAQVKFTAFVTGGSGGMIPERAEGYRITTQWRFEDGGWLVEYAEWE